MITCSACGFSNPMGTRWCRQCGEKLDLNAGQVQAALAATTVAAHHDRLLGYGRSAVSLGAFVLIVALILRYALVPDLPRADAYVTLPAQLLPAIARRATDAAPPSLSAISSQRLRWRATICRPTANQLGLDLAQMDQVRTAIGATQKPDGTWNGDDPLATTALATLALQAWPDDQSLARAAVARTWLASQLSDPTRRSIAGRTLALVALDDAEALRPAERTRLQSYLIDGKLARFQTWALITTPLALQAPELGLVREAFDSTDGDLLWRGVFTLATGTLPDLPVSRFFTDSVGQVVAEDRPAWALLAWHLGLAPGDVSQILRDWSRQAVPPITDPALAKTGAQAAEALWLIALAAPVRVPPMTLQSAQ